MAKTRWGGNAQSAGNDGPARVRKPVGGMYVNPPEQVNAVKEMFDGVNLKIVLSKGSKLLLEDENGNAIAYDNDSVNLRVFVNDRPKDDKSFHLNLVGYVDPD